MKKKIHGNTINGILRHAKERCIVRHNNETARRMKFINDVDKKHRLASKECRACFYNSRFGGAAMTGWECRFCPKTGLAGSTCTPQICSDCSAEYYACSFCLGHLYT